MAGWGDSLCLNNQLMGRPSKKVESEPAKTQDKEVKSDEAVKVEEHTDNIQPDIPEKILELMRLYPHYEKFWVTSKGFVHPDGVPQYLIKDATLYTNIYYNK